MQKKALFTLMLSVLLILSMLMAGCSAEPASSNGQTAESQDQTEQQSQEEPKTLFAYVGANLKDPVSEIAAAYELETGVKVELTFNNSGSLLAQIETTQKGDIYIPGGMPAVNQATEKGFIDQSVGPLAYPTPVIITPNDNPAGIASVEDLAKDGVKLVIPDKEATAIGKSAYKVFDAIGKTAEIEKNIAANLESPAKVMEAIKMGQADAGIVEYSNTVKAKDAVSVIEIDPKVNVIEMVTATSLTFAEDKELAADFLKYLEENGPAAFEKYGFKITKPE